MWLGLFFTWTEHSFNSTTPRELIRKKKYQTISMTSETSTLPAPRKKVSFQIAGDPNGGIVFFYGNPNSSSIVIFCGGYPDDHENGQLFCSCLAKENGTLVGLTCLPGFDDRPEKRWQTHKPEGYTFDEMTDVIRDAVKVLRAESTNEKAILTAIFHDLGVGPGMMWANRSLEDDDAVSPDDIVLFDVLPPVKKYHSEDLPTFSKPSFHSIFVKYYYRMIFAMAFALQSYLSNYLAMAYYLVGSWSMKLLPIFPLCSDPDWKIINAREAADGLSRVIYMGYPYYYMFKGLFNIESLSDISLPIDLRKTPVLFLYGPDKRVQFHDERSIFILEREANENRSKSKAMKVANAGHWLYLEQTDLCVEEVKKFMSK